ncbi:MAG: helix-turn-helix transcriptional regulator [Bacteroidetes bacterium]|nr:helix-turn-helix transcriptional regulator [Bacteroidota bacterium]
MITRDGIIYDKFLRRNPGGFLLREGMPPALIQAFDSSYLNAHLLMRDLEEALQQLIRAYAKKLPSSRHSTRLDIATKIINARSYMRVHLNRPINLMSIGRHSSMSLNHLLRNYKLIFHETPSKDIAADRIDIARLLLAETNLKVHDIVMRVGFQNHSSFSRLFKNSVGVNPESYRQGKRPNASSTVLSS